MAAMTTVLTEFSDNGNTRTYTAPSHTVLQPFLVIQSRKVPTGNAVIAEDTIKVVKATSDSNGDPIAERQFITVTVHRPITGDDTDMDDVKALVREVVASDEFDAVVDTQNHLQ